MSDNWSASADFMLVTPNGERSPLTVRIGVPQQSADGTWACAASLRGLYDEHPPMIGEDSLQALGLAWSLTERLLRQFQLAGSIIEYPTGESVPLDACFGRTEPNRAG